MTGLQPFHLAVAEEKLYQLRSRIASFPWDRLPDAGGWRCGTDRSFMMRLAAYWLDQFDWRLQERRLNAIPQFKVTLDGIDLHFFHLKRGSGAKPVLLLHGWPGSAFEFFELMQLATGSEQQGQGDAEDFDIVVPCLPGYGFSGAPARPIGFRYMAAVFDRLMTQVLGYERYLVQGGDLGASIAAWMGFDYPAHCRGVHLNMLFIQPPRLPAGAEEMAWAQQFANTLQREGAYAQLQGTKPQTLSYAMTDNPIGVAAWIIEKFATWADLPRGCDGAPDLLSAFSFDQLLTNIMFYVATDSFTTATWPYYCLLSGGELQSFPEGRRCEVPVGVALFKDPVFQPMPRSMADSIYNIVHWQEMPRGGHFAAMEQPQLLLDDLRMFSRHPAVK